MVLEASQLARLDAHLKRLTGAAHDHFLDTQSSGDLPRSSTRKVAVLAQSGLDRLCHLGRNHGHRLDDPVLALRLGAIAKQTELASGVRGDGHEIFRGDFRYPCERRGCDLSPLRECSGHRSGSDGEETGELLG